MSISKQQKREEKLKRRKEKGLVNNTRIVERKNSNPSVGELKIIDFCIKYKVRFTREHFIKKVNAGGYFLFMDFFLRDFGIVIEYDGIQHYEPVYGEEALLKQQRLDKIKNDLCRKQGLKMIRISYKDLDLVHDILFKILSASRLKKQVGNCNQFNKNGHTGITI